MAIDQQVAQHAECIEALVVAVGQELFSKCLLANQRAREAALVAQSKAQWDQRVADGEAHRVLAAEASSFVIGTWDRAGPMCGPLAALPEETRAKVLGARVGTRVKVGKQLLVLTTAYEDGPAPAEAKGKRKGKR